MAKTYATSDLPEAAALKCAKFQLIDYVNSEGKIYFIFAESKELSDAKIVYINGKMLVEPRQYQTEMEGLRNVVKQLKRA